MRSTSRIRCLAGLGLGLTWLPAGPRAGAGEYGYRVVADRGSYRNVGIIGNTGEGRADDVG
jgi:hypothetical protein